MYTLPLESCVGVLGLTKNQWLSDLDNPPHFPSQNAKIAEFSDNRHVICELDKSEAAKLSWKSGFYRLDLKRTQVRERIEESRLT